jgi:hypothetical protein
MALNTTMKDVKIEVVTAFHFLDRYSSQLVRGSFIPEFLASYLAGLRSLEEPWLWSHLVVWCGGWMCNIRLQSGHPTPLPLFCQNHV